MYTVSLAFYCLLPRDKPRHRVTQRKLDRKLLATVLDGVKFPASATHPSEPYKYITGPANKHSTE